MIKNIDKAQILKLKDLVEYKNGHVISKRFKMLLTVIF